MERVISAACYILLAPFVGGILAGLDRKITARMQNRVGPPLLQPFYDVLKLFEKESLVVNRYQNFYIFCFLLFIVFTGTLFFSGGDLLLVVFALTLASIFFILGGFSTHSPYSSIGADREMIQMMAYEPMVIIATVGIYLITKSFFITDIIRTDVPLILYLPGIFIGFVFILTIKFRKSPFDLSMSHHAHQEIVRGIITEFTGRSLAIIEIAHWYENVFLLGIVYLFFSFNPVLGIACALFTYFLEMFIDNVYARMKWELVFKSSWIVALVFGSTNLVVLYVLKLWNII